MVIKYSRIKIFLQYFIEFLFIDWMYNPIWPLSNCNNVIIYIQNKTVNILGCLNIRLTLFVGNTARRSREIQHCQNYLMPRRCSSLYEIFLDPPSQLKIHLLLNYPCLPRSSLEKQYDMPQNCFIVVGRAEQRLTSTTLESSDLNLV